MKYHGTYSCGHEGTVDIGGKTKDREWKRSRTFSGLCPECAKAQREKEREKKIAAAQKEAEAEKYPDLQGSQKQIAWAITIRQEFLFTLKTQIEKGKEQNGAEKLEKAEALLNWIIESKTKASDWIENREASFSELFAKFAEEFTALGIKEEVKTKEELAHPAKKTAIPEERTEDGVVEIIVKDKKVFARYQKNDHFRAIVKEKGYRWDGTCWHKDVSEFSGAIEDRAIEIANALLTEGFAVEIEESLLERAVSGSFEPEQTRWVKKLVTGNYAGWFSVSWRGKDDDLYDKARRLPESRWHNHQVVAPSTSFEEIEDFAEMEGFGISEGAKELIEEKKRNAFVVKPQKRQEEKCEDKLNEQLKTSVAIPEDLMDE